MTQTPEDVVEVVGRQGSSATALFLLPRAGFEALLEEAMRNAPWCKDPQEAKILAASRTRQPISILYWVRTTYAVAALLEQHLGTAYCPECSRTYPAAELRRESQEIIMGPLSGGGGRRFTCPANHLLLETMDWRG